MNLKGLDALRAHIPETGGSMGPWRPVLALALVFLLTTLFFIAADRGFAEWMPDGEIVVLALGFLILSRFYSQRENYRRKYGALAFQKATANFSIPGLGIVAASIAHLAYIAGPGIPNIWWRPWLIALGWILLLVGVGLWLRAAQALGIDNGAMLYVYYPEEGRLLEDKIYGLIRHPIYSAALDMAFGLALIYANWYALLVALIMPIFFFGWARLIEEPELIKRFPSYLDYRKRVPAFGPRPIHWLEFFGYLISGH